MSETQEIPPRRLGINHIAPGITQYFVNARLVLGITQPISGIDHEWIQEQYRRDPGPDMIQNLTLFRDLLKIEGVVEPMDAGPSYVSLRYSSEWDEFVLRMPIARVIGATLHWDAESFTHMPFDRFLGTAVVNNDSQDGAS